MISDLFTIDMEAVIWVSSNYANVKLLNSAPFKLRDGDPSLNHGIGSASDPMGDINQKLTTKEQRLYKRYHV